MKGQAQTSFKIMDLAEQLETLQHNAKQYLKRIQTLEEGRTLDVDSLANVPNMAALLPALSEIKSDLLQKFCPKDQMKDIEKKLFAIEELVSRGPSIV